MPSREKQDPAKQTDLDPLPAGDRRRPWRILLSLYIVALAGLVFWCYTDSARWESLTWRPELANWIIQLAGQIGSSVLRELLLFLGLGVLAGASCGPAGGASLARVSLSILIACGVSLGIALVVRTLVRGTPIIAPSLLTIMLLVPSCLWGSWLGVTYLCAKSRIGWLLKQAVLAVVVVCGVAAVLIWFALSREPLDIASAQVSTGDRRRLVKLFQEHDPRDLAVDETTELTVTQQDINQLMSWGLSLLPGDQRAELWLEGDAVSMKATFPVPRFPVAHSHLNLMAAGRPLTRGGQLGFLPSSLEIGSLKVPKWLIKLTGPVIIGREWRNTATEPFFRSLQTVKIDEGAVSVCYGFLDPQLGMVRDALVDLGLLEDLEAATNAHITRLIAVAEENPKLTFAQCVETAFGEARIRSQNGDAALENRAAMLALGYLLGHPKIQKFVGPSLLGPSNKVQRRFHRVTLRNRRDWTRHYTLSAALQVLSNALASMDAGILKEELDSDGGSGFSFGDLLADRAGTMLAVRATESEFAAKAMQNRIAAGFKVEDFMPDGSDLPEGLSDEQLQEQYGGVGGEGYQRLLAEIDRRIESCPAYKTQ